jgi:hypothetical protein
VARFEPNHGREQIHLPGPSVIPAITAAGITIALLGLIYSWWIVGFGGLVTLVALVAWIRTVRDEIDSFPAERPQR